MKILILEDEPIIAIDLEEIVTETLEVSVVHALTVDQALRQIDQPSGEPIAFALLDLVIGTRGAMALAVAEHLSRNDIPFCFVSSATERLPERFRSFPRLSKPFRAREVTDVVRTFGSRHRGSMAKTAEAVAA